MAMHVISCRSARTSCSARAMSSTARCFSGLTSGDKSMRCLAKTPLAVPTSLSWSAQVAAGQYAISAAHNRNRHAVLSSNGKHIRWVSHLSATEHEYMVWEAEAPKQPPQKPMQQQELQGSAWLTWIHAKVVPVLGAIYLFFAIGLLSIAPLDLSPENLSIILMFFYSAAVLLDLWPSAFRFFILGAAPLIARLARGHISGADVISAIIFTIFMDIFIFPQTIQRRRQPARATCTAGDKGNDRKSNLKAQPT